MEQKQSQRIQTSLLNGVEKKALVWLAERQPKWVTSDILSAVGFVGSLLIALGYILSNKNINYLWLSSLGFVVNWYGDSLDGTLARIRHKQRPVYGYYLDHTLDAVNEVIMFSGAGLSAMMHNFSIALALLVLYLLLTLNVSINAHLKSEFRLTYAKLGPTEFRLIMIIVNTLFIFVRPLQEYCGSLTLFGKTYSLGALDVIGLGVLAVLTVIYIVAVLTDLRGYDKSDPMPQ